MRREPVDFFTIRAGHHAIHERLINWSRWADPGTASGYVLPMFKFYEPYLVPRDAGPRVPVNSKDAVAVQKLLHLVPERNRIALVWCYVFSYRPPAVPCRRLGVNRGQLVEMIHDARTMLKNISCRQEPVVLTSRKFNPSSMLC